MDLERYTNNAKETMVEAMESARALGHQTITTTHVIKAILLNNKKRFSKLIDLAGGDFFSVLQEADKLLISQPRVEGYQNLFIDTKLSEAIKAAEIFAVKLGDKFIGLESLFLGIALGKCELAKKLANEMKNSGVLISVDGPDHNVLKIKPPIIFNYENADELVFNFRSVLDKYYYA